MLAPDDAASSHRRHSVLAEGSTVQAVNELAIPALNSGAARAPARHPLVRARRLRPYAVLDGFAFDRVDVPPRHVGTIQKVARLVLASQASPRPIRAIRLVG